VSLDVTPTSVEVGDSVTITTNGSVSQSGDCDTKPLALRIRVYVDGQLVKNFDCGAPYGSDCTKGPFSFKYAFDEEGDHTVKAQMVWDDCDGATRDDAWSSSVTVSVRKKPNTSVSVSVSPKEVNVGEPVHISADAWDPRGISTITVYVNAHSIGTKNCGGSPANPSCTYSVDYTPESPGVYHDHRLQELQVQHHIPRVLHSEDGLPTYLCGQILHKGRCHGLQEPQCR